MLYNGGKCQSQNSPKAESKHNQVMMEVKWQLFDLIRFELAKLITFQLNAAAECLYKVHEYYLASFPCVVCGKTWSLGLMGFVLILCNMSMPECNKSTYFLHPYAAQSSLYQLYQLLSSICISFRPKKKSALRVAMML